MNSIYKLMQTKSWEIVDTFKWLIWFAKRFWKSNTWKCPWVHSLAMMMHTFNDGPSSTCALSSCFGWAIPRRRRWPLSFIISLGAIGSITIRWSFPTSTIQIGTICPCSLPRSFLNTWKAEQKINGASMIHEPICKISWK